MTILRIIFFVHLIAVSAHANSLIREFLVVFHSPKIDKELATTDLPIARSIRDIAELLDLKVVEITEPQPTKDYVGENHAGRHYIYAQPTLMPKSLRITFEARNPDHRKLVKYGFPINEEDRDRDDLSLLHIFFVRRLEFVMTNPDVERVLAYCIRSTGMNDFRTRFLTIDYGRSLRAKLGEYGVDPITRTEYTTLCGGPPHSVPTPPMGYQHIVYAHIDVMSLSDSASGVRTEVSWNGVDKPFVLDEIPRADQLASLVCSLAPTRAENVASCQ